MERTGNRCPQCFQEMGPVSGGKTTLAVDCPIPKGLLYDVDKSCQDLLRKDRMGTSDSVVTMVLLG